MIDVSMAKLTGKILYTLFSCSVAIRERRIYINVPMAVLVPLTAAFINQKVYWRRKIY